MPISLIGIIPKHLNRKEESFWIIAVNPFYNRIDKRSAKITEKAQKKSAKELDQYAKKYMNMKHLEAIQGDASIAG